MDRLSWYDLKLISSDEMRETVQVRKSLIMPKPYI